LLGLTAGASVAVVRWFSRRGQLRQVRDDATRLIERTPYDLKVGDVIQHVGEDFVVDGNLVVAGEGRTLRLHQATESTRPRYLFAKEARTELWWLDEGIPVAIGPLVTETVELLGKSWRLQSISTGAATFIGTIPEAVSSAARMRMIELVTADEVLLIVDDGNRGLAFRGSAHPAHQFEFLPGS